MIRTIHMLSPLALILTVLLSCTAQAATYQDARAAYDRSEFLLAQSLWRSLAEGGDVEAMFALGALLYEGPGEVPINYLESSEWYARAADLGHADAQYNLGNAYQRGLGVWQDDVQAAHWWRKAAAQGLPKAAYNLGVQYGYGRGVVQSREQALYWFRQAADKGHLQARQLLADLVPGEDTNTETEHSSQWVEAAPLPQSVTERAPVEPPPAVPVINESSLAAVQVPVADDSLDDFDMFDLGERRLLSAQAASFTLQLTAMSSAQRLQDYILMHDLEGELIQFRFMAADRTLFGLSHGVYLSRKDGEAALEQLQQRHGQQPGWQTPWLRATDDLKILIRKINQSTASKND